MRLWQGNANANAKAQRKSGATLALQARQKDARKKAKQNAK
jgi:hypothetical protein